MKKIKVTISYKDKRGLIADLLERQNINAITFITNSKYFTGSTLFLDGGFK